MPHDPELEIGSQAAHFLFGSLMFMAMIVGKVRRFVPVPGRYLHHRQL